MCVLVYKRYYNMYVLRAVRVLPEARLLLEKTNASPSATYLPPEQQLPSGQNETKKNWFNELMMINNERKHFHCFNKQKS